MHHRRENLRRLAERLRTPLLDATPEDLDRWQASLGVSTSSRATYTTHVAGFYRWAVESGHIDHDPTTRLPRPRVPIRSARPIPEADLKIALECAPEPIRTWLVLASHMGLRAMEVAGIRREDVTESGGRYYLSGIGKGQKPFKLPVPKDVVPVLLPHLSGRIGPLWSNPQGGPIKPITVTNQVSRFFRTLGMPYTLHWCRHYFGTEAHRQTHDLLTTMTLMRHSSPDTTRIYVQQIPEEAMAVMDRMSRRLRPPSKRRPGSSPPGVPTGEGEAA